MEYRHGAGEKRGGTHLSTPLCGRGFQKYSLALVLLFSHGAGEFSGINMVVL